MCAYSHLEKRIAESWVRLRQRGLSGQDCVRIYLTVARKWQFYGAKLFSAKLKHTDPQTVAYAWLAVQEDSISVLDYSNLVSVRRDRGAGYSSHLINGDLITYSMSLPLVY